MDKSPPSISISESEVFIILSKSHCRQTLRILQKSNPPLTVIELAHQIANREYDAVSDQEVQTIHLALHHNFLPRLDDADVVEYDPDKQTICPGINFDAMMSFLEKVDEMGLPRSG